jgi:hypothetical protein
MLALPTQSYPRIPGPLRGAGPRLTETAAMIIRIRCGIVVPVPARLVDRAEVDTDHFGIWSGSVRAVTAATSNSMRRSTARSGSEFQSRSSTSPLPFGLPDRLTTRWPDAFCGCRAPMPQDRRRFPDNVVKPGSWARPATGGCRVGGTAARPTSRARDRSDRGPQDGGRLRASKTGGVAHQRELRREQAQHTIGVEQ